jgi:hypothetical protein
MVALVALAERVSADRRRGPRQAGVGCAARPCRRHQWQEEHGPGEIIEQFLNATGETGEGSMRRDADRPLFKDVVRHGCTRRA